MNGCYLLSSPMDTLHAKLSNTSLCLNSGSLKDEGNSIPHSALLYSLDTPPGTKLLFKDLKFNDGFLLMDKDVQVLGGAVPALIEAWKAAQVSLFTFIPLVCPFILLFSVFTPFIHTFYYSLLHVFVKYYSIHCVH
jgi:hypothetical protein